MAPSILRRLLLSFLGFAFLVAAAFPFYANFFVVWKPDMLAWFVVGCLVAGLVIGLTNYWLLNMLLLKKLRRISEVAQAVSGKDLTVRCTLQSADTIGEIIASFNTMTQNLREVLGQGGVLSGAVRENVDAMREAIEAIRSNVDEESVKAAQISDAIEHMSRTVAEISQSTDEAATQAKQTAGAAAEGGQVVHRAIAGMDKISVVVNESAQAVENLGHSSNQIGAIVAVIKEIAEHTNLLALNAAIEAARAGEQGRGFAVVADEVRKLAEKTAQATQEIAEMIQTIQRETGEVIATMEAGTSEVRAGVDLVRATGATLEQIVVGIERLATMVQDIAQATTTQTGDIGRIGDNVGGIAALISGTGQSAQQGAAKAEDLTRLAAALDNAVKGFRLA
ncbi:MAG: HAMP domain-containing methyl-accepting chemotaxis protein [Betaproteobacteria bacterium]|nr:HAMP domain-containing methyl-accepting chemotaxis protein [Betaproteobacteria bacterium]